MSAAVRSPRRHALLITGLMLGLAPAVAAQTIRPLISEYRTKAHGRIELVNGTVWPADVVVEARSFVVDEMGELHDRPLDPSIHLELSAMSLRIPPQQTRYVFYKATADRMPAWFVLYAGFRNRARPDLKGIDVQIELPHVVYLLPKDRVKSDDILVSVKERGEDGKVLLDVYNTGPSFGRVLATELHGDDGTTAGPSFPLFPNSPRRGGRLRSSTRAADPCPCKRKTMTSRLALASSATSSAWEVA